MFPSLRAGRLARVVLLVAASVAVLAGCASAPSVSAGHLAVRDAWSGAAAAGTETAAYLTIANPGAADVLLSVRCTIASSAMLHQTGTDPSGMTGMTMLDKLPIPAGATVSLAPGGTHVMIAGLNRALEAGASVELHLTFERAGEVVVDAPVRPS